MAVAIQIRRGTAAQWAQADPILLEGELGLETDSKHYKIGDGVTPWNSLSYGSQLQPTLDVATLENQITTPSTPSAGYLKLYAKSLGGRMLPRILGPSGLSTPLQPSFFQNCIVMIQTGTTTTLQVLGNTVISVGTISHPAATQQYGYMANIVTLGTALGTAGTGNYATLWQRGDIVGQANGFFFVARVAFPDLSYNQTGVDTGTRIFVGLTSGTMAASVGIDNPAGNHIGFQRCHTDAGRQDTNWQLMTKDNTTQAVIDTTLPFLAEKIYDCYLFCPPAGEIIYWRIDNITDGTTKEGSVINNLPLANTLLRAGLQLQSVDAVARNIRMQRVYTEADR